MNKSNSNYKTRFITSKDGTKIAFKTLGSGENVITVFGATCHKEFLPVKSDVKELSKFYTVTNYDRRGRGDSLQHHDWSLKKEIEDIESLITEIGQPVYLYGHSSGAIVALEAAYVLGSKVKGVIVYDTAYSCNEKDKFELIELGKSIKKSLASGKNAQAIKQFLVGVGMPRVFAYALPLFPGWEKIKQLAPTLMYDIELTATLPPREKLQGIAQPVLIMAGGKNPPSIKEVYAELIELIPRSSHQMFESLDHMAHIKNLVPTINSFVVENQKDNPTTN